MFGQDYTRLMTRKIRSILLICNNYDSFSLEEDGHIEGQISQDYAELNLSNPPSIDRVESTLEALEQAGGSYTILRDYGDVFWDIRMNINDVTNNFANPFTLPEAPQRGAGRK